MDLPGFVLFFFEKRKLTSEPGERLLFSNGGEYVQKGNPFELAKAGGG